VDSVHLCLLTDAPCFGLLCVFRCVLWSAKQATACTVWVLEGPSMDASAVPRKTWWLSSGQVANMPCCLQESTRTPRRPQEGCTVNVQGAPQHRTTVLLYSHGAGHHTQPRNLIILCLEPHSTNKHTHDGANILEHHRTKPPPPHAA
jgi:hypothetical protein